MVQIYCVLRSQITSMMITPDISSYYGATMAAEEVSGILNY